jgi:predicted SAM-dependent methyltransferase
MKVHIGCGKRNFGEDWYHIDGSSYPHVKSHDIRSLPFEDNTVNVIYASHVLEYFDREEVFIVLEEWKRCLRPGGTIRLAVPDFEQMVKLYVKGTVKLNNIIGPLYGKWQMDENTTIYHKTTYDYLSLEKVLKECGFVNVELWDWRKTDHSNFDDYSQAYVPHMDKENGTLISLNIQATK